MAGFSLFKQLAHGNIQHVRYAEEHGQRHPGNRLPVVGFDPAEKSGAASDLLRKLRLSSAGLLAVKFNV